MKNILNLATAALFYKYAKKNNWTSAFALYKAFPAMDFSKSALIWGFKLRNTEVYKEPETGTLLEYTIQRLSLIKGVAQSQIDDFFEFQLSQPNLNMDSLMKVLDGNSVLSTFIRTRPQIFDLIISKIQDPQLRQAKCVENLSILMADYLQNKASYEDLKSVLEIYQKYGANIPVAIFAYFLVSPVLDTKAMDLFIDNMKGKVLDPNDCIKQIKSKNVDTVRNAYDIKEIEKVHIYFKYLFKMGLDTNVKASSMVSIADTALLSGKVISYLAMKSHPLPIHQDDKVFKEVSSVFTLNKDSIYDSKIESLRDYINSFVFVPREKYLLEKTLRKEDIPATANLKDKNKI